MGNYNAELVKAGVMLAGEGLQASSKGARVKFSGSKRTVIDGPFTETKELIAGFWILQVKSKEEAQSVYEELSANQIPAHRDGLGHREISQQKFLRNNECNPD